MDTSGQWTGKAVKKLMTQCQTYYVRVCLVKCFKDYHTKINYWEYSAR